MRVGSSRRGVVILSRPARVCIEDGLLLGTLVLLPWAFGGVELWAYRSAGFLIVMAAAFAVWRGGFRAGLGLGPSSTWLVPAGFLALWGAVQLVPLPPSLLARVSPGAERIYSATLPWYPSAAPANALGAIEEHALLNVPEAEGVPFPAGREEGLSAGPESCARAWRTISLYPDATEDRLFWFVALLLGFMTVRQRVADRGTHALYRSVLFAAFGLLALFAMVQAATWNGRIYWLRPIMTAEKAFGPYVNPTHFAGVMELALPWLLGFAASRLQRWGRAALSRPEFLLPVVSAIFCGAATVMAASKMSAALTGLNLTLLLAFIAARRWGRLITATALVILWGLAVLLVMATPLGQRISSHVERSEGVQVVGTRGPAWQAAFTMLADYPITGTGFGTFREVFPAYMPSGTYIRWNEAHSDWLELLLDGGLLAGVLVAWLAVAYVVQLSSRSAKVGARGSPTRFGLILGLASLSLHAAVDFNHQIPANALLFVALAAMALPRESRGSSNEHRVAGE